MFPVVVLVAGVVVVGLVAAGAVVAGLGALAGGASAVGGPAGIGKNFKRYIMKNPPVPEGFSFNRFEEHLIRIPFYLLQEVLT